MCAVVLCCAVVFGARWRRAPHGGAVIVSQRRQGGLRGVLPAHIHVYHYIPLYVYILFYISAKTKRTNEQPHLPSAHDPAVWGDKREQRQGAGIAQQRDGDPRVVTLCSLRGTHVLGTNSAGVGGLLPRRNNPQRLNVIFQSSRGLFALSSFCCCFFFLFLSRQIS